MMSRSISERAGDWGCCCVRQRTHYPFYRCLWCFAGSPEATKQRTREFQSNFRSPFLLCDQRDEPRLLGRSAESKKPPFIGHPALRVPLRWQLRRPTNDEGDQIFSFHGHVRWKGLFVTILGHI